MRFPQKFPYTSINNINLDWIIKQVKKLSKAVEEIDPEAIAEEIADVRADASTALSTANSANTAAQSAVSSAAQANTNAAAASAAAQNATTAANTANAKADTATNAATNLNTLLAQRPRSNKLDNAYFVGGGSQRGGDTFPVNQRGQTIYSNPGFIFDRWKLVSGSVTLSNDGIILHGTITQTLANKIGAVNIATFLYSNGNIGLATYNDDTRLYTLTADSDTPIMAAYLEIGTTATQYFISSGVIHNQYLPKFAEELTICQRYYLHHVGYASVGFLADTGSAYVNIVTPSTMAREPSMEIVQYNNLIHGTTLEPITRANISALRTNAVSVEVGVATTGVFELCMTADFMVNLSAEI